MKKKLIIYFELVFIGVILACANGIQLKPVYDAEVSIAWDAVTTLINGSSVQESGKIKYLVYIDRIDKRDGAQLVNKYIGSKLVDKQMLIAETSCTIKFMEKGQFVVGVQSVFFDEENQKKVSSTIAWSDNKIYTNNNPFFVQNGE